MICKIIEEECALQPSGLQPTCLDSCPRAIEFMHCYGLKPVELSEDAEIASYLESLADGAGNEFLSRCLRHTAQFLHKGG